MHAQIYEFILFSLVILIILYFYESYSLKALHQRRRLKIKIGFIVQHCSPSTTTRWGERLNLLVSFLRLAGAAASVRVPVVVGLIALGLDDRREVPSAWVGRGQKALRVLLLEQSVPVRVRRAEHCRRNERRERGLHRERRRRRRRGHRVHRVLPGEHCLHRLQDVAAVLLEQALYLAPPTGREYSAEGQIGLVSTRFGSREFSLNLPQQDVDGRSLCGHCAHELRRLMVRHESAALAVAPVRRAAHRADALHRRVRRRRRIVFLKAEILRRRFVGRRVHVQIGLGRARAAVAVRRTRHGQTKRVVFRAWAARWRFRSRVVVRLVRNSLPFWTLSRKEGISLHYSHSARWNETTLLINLIADIIEIYLRKSFGDRMKIKISWRIHFCSLRGRVKLNEFAVNNAPPIGEFHRWNFSLSLLKCQNGNSGSPLIAEHTETLAH